MVEAAEVDLADQVEEAAEVLTAEVLTADRHITQVQVRVSIVIIKFQMVFTLVYIASQGSL